MNPLLPTAFAAAPFVALAAVVRLERLTRRTTLWPAWWWLLGANLAWAATGLASVAGVASAGTLDRCWYGTAVLALCGPVHVLGARRPGSASWTWFVVLPMLAVLGLPIATSFGANAVARFEIELPPLLGYLLVLVMGAGNYFGTRFTAPALLFAAGLVTIVLAGSTAAPNWLPPPNPARAIGSGLVAFAAVLAARRASAAAPASLPPLERLWLDVRDLFGIVWAKRVMDRVNESLEAANAAGRLDLDGFVFPDPGPSDDRRQHTFDTAGKTLDWLLKRFVDEDWKRDRLAVRETSRSSDESSPRE